MRFDLGIHASGGLSRTRLVEWEREVEIYEPAADRWFAKDLSARQLARFGGNERRST